MADIPAEQLIQTAQGPQTAAQFYGVTEIPRPQPNVTTIPAPVELSDEETLALAGFREVPQADELAAAGFKEVDPLDVSSDEDLKKDKNFNPILYFNEHGEGAMEPAKLERLANIFKAKAEQGVSAGDVGDFFKKLGKGAIAAVWEIPRGLAVTAERAIVGPIAGAVGEFIPGQTGKEVQEFARQQMGELAAGIEAEATGLSELARTGAQKLFTKAPATTEEAKQLLIDWAARTRQVEKAAVGKGALSEDAGVELDPEAVQHVAAGGPLSLVAFGSAFKLVNAAGKTILKAPTKLSAFRAVQELRRASAAETAAGQALAAGPRTAGLEAATGAAVAERQAAEAAVRATPGAQAVNVLGQAAERVGEAITAPKIAGTAAQAAGLTAEAAGWTARLGSRALRATRPLGIPIGSLFGVPLAGVAEGISAAGRGLRAAGAAVKAEAPELAARRAQDVINASADVLKSAGTGTAIDYGFALGTAKTDEEAREMPSVGGALGFLAGGARGARRVLAGELIQPKTAPFRQIDSPAYGENSILDSAHETGMERSSPEAQNQVNAVREIARKLGGRVYVMPDEATFRQVLDDVWKRQNNAETVPTEVSQAHANWASQNGMFSTSILGPDGKPQNIAFIRDPAALAHEGIGHVIDRVLPDDVNAALDRQVRENISPENWEAAGNYYAQRLTGKPVTDWRQTLREAGVDLDPDIYLAREVRAENMDVAFRNRGEAFATSPGLYRWLAQTVGRIAEQAGINLGEVSPELGLPVSIETMARGEKAARGIIESEAQQNLIQARDARLRERAEVSPVEPVSPPAETAPKALPEVQEAKDWIDANPQKVTTPEAATAGKAIADAINAGQPVRVSYWAAKGTPAGETVSLRPERRAEIESQRQAANEDRQLVEHEFTPYRVEVRSTGPQFVGWSRDILNANVNKFQEWASKLKDKSRIPYETDANGLTENGLAQLKEDARVYQENQANGFTGAGEKIVVPEAAEKLGAFKPEESGTPLPLPQERADVINYLFNTKIPETAGRLAPLHLAGQEVSAATLPGRIELPIRRRGEYSEATLKKAGITEPKGVREVNPFRQWVESQPGEAPSLVEVSQRLNLARIEEAQSAGPGAEPVRGNVLTQAAGFQPKALGTTAEEIQRLRDFSTEEFRAYMDGYASDKYGKGLTGWAFDVGSRVKTPEEVAALRSVAETFSEMRRDAMKNRDMDNAFAFANRSQAAKEAYQMATGTNLEGQPATVEFIRNHYDPNYQPPMPPKGEAFQPRERKLGEEEAGKILALHKKAGGSTYSLVAGKSQAGTKGFSVAVYPERSKIIDGPPTEQNIKDFIAENTDVLFDAENENSLGTWENEGKTYLDVVRIETSRGRAIDLAKQWDQKAIFDLKSGREIPTGGTGAVPPKATPATAATQLPLASGTRGLEFSTSESTGGINKSWILPDGTPIQTGGEWHHEWLANNPEIAKRYNLDVPDFEGSDAGTVREDALKKGFTRVNYVNRNGTLTVEARAKDWKKIKPTIEDMVDANIDRIDNMTVTLYDDNVTKVVDSDSARLFDMTDREKMQNIPLITKSEARGESFQPQRIEWEDFGKELDSSAFSGEAEISLSELIKAGAKSLDIWDTGGFHDVRTLLSVRQDGSGRWPVTEEGLRAAYQNARAFEVDAFNLSRRKDDNESFQPKALPGEPSERTSMKYFDAVPEFRATGAKGKHHLWDGMNFLSEANAKLEKLPETDPPTKEKLARALAEETLHALENNPDALGWYDRKVKETLELLSELHPELKDNPDLFALYKALIAVTSNGQAVRENFFRADELYEGWKKSKALPTDSNWGGPSAPAINSGLETLNTFLKEKGLAGTREFLETEYTIGQLKKMGFNVPAEKVSTKVRGSQVFGPKVGAFFANLNGDFSPVTMDRWFMRTFNRVRGLLTEVNPKAVVKHIDGVLAALGYSGEDFGFNIREVRKDLTRLRKAVEAGEPIDYSRPAVLYTQARFRDYAKTFEDRNPLNRAIKLLNEQLFPIHQHPANGGERAWVREVVGEAQKMLNDAGVNLTNADMQALLWYYEKELYAKLGFENPRATGVDYASAARQLLDARRGRGGGAAEPGPSGTGVAKRGTEPNAGTEGGESESNPGIEIEKRPGY